MPSDLSFENRKELLQHLEEQMGITDDKKREEVADIVIDEAESDEGNPQKLLESIKDGAKSILSGIGLETVSWVENPSQDSMFVMMKGDNPMIRKTSKIFKEPEEDWETVYGPVMRPNDIDKDGDVAPAHDIRKAAHEFMAEGRVKQFDTDHDLNTGKGTLVESWILKEDTEYQLPDGSTETIQEGSWMVGVQPTKEVKQRIESGDITGWSIFGQADKIELGKQPRWKNFKGDQISLEGKENTMSENPDNETEQELSLKDVHSELKEFRESFNEYKEAPEPSTVKSMEELKNHVKSEETSNLVELGKDFELETTEKEPEMESMGDLMDFLEDSLNEDNFSMLMDAVRGDSVEEEMDEDEEEEEDSEGYDNAEKEAKNKHRQVDTNFEKGSTKSVSFRERIEA